MARSRRFASRLGIAVFAVFWAAPCPAAFTPGTLHARSMVYRDVERVYDVWVPATYDGSSPVPLVLDLHGYGSNKTAQRGVSGFQAQANLHGFLVAWPQARFGAVDNPEGRNMPAGPSWNGGGACCGDAAARRVDDVGFLNAVATAIAKEANVDVRRVYTTGISNGGAMSHLMACRSANTIAASAPVAFPLNLNPLSECQPSRPIAVRHYAGLTDSLVPYGATGPTVVGAQTSFAYWRDVTSCAGTIPDETVVHGTSWCESYSHCAGNVEIALCSINASTSTPLPGHITYINPDLNLAADAWAFLSRFEAPAPVCGDGEVGAGEECDDGNTAAGDGCDAGCDLEPCGPAPEAACRATTRFASHLRIRDDEEEDGDRVQWTWARGLATRLDEFGDPATNQQLWMCVYADGMLRSATAVDPGGACDGTGPCWKKGSSGYRYRDDTGSRGGITRLDIRAGDKGEARIRWKGSGPGLAMPGSLSGTVVVQMKKTGGGVCWQSTFREPHKTNTAGRFAATGI